MDDRNSVTITLRGGLVEAALVWLQDGEKSSVLAAASKQGSGHIKDCVAGLEVPWPFLCRLSFLSFFSARSRRPICARDALRAANLSITVLLARSPFCVRSAVQARKPIWTVLLARSPFCARSAMQAPKPIWAVLLARSPICAHDALRASKPI